MAATRPKLPVVTPSYTGLDWTGATVINVASTDSINTKLDLAVSTLQGLGPGGKVDVLLQAGATWNEMVVLQKHGVKGGRIRIITNGWSLAYPTKLTPTLAAAQNIATILAPDNQNSIVVAVGSRGWHLRGLKFTCSTTQGTPAFVNYSPLEGVTQIADIAWSHSLTQCWCHGNAAGQTRRNGITATAAMLEIAYCYVDHVNYGGEDYSHQGQALSIPTGIGRLNVHDNYLYRAGEAIAVGGSGQYTAFGASGEALVPCDITIKNNHIFTPLSMKGRELCANAIEAKEGRRFLIEGNWIQNVWKDGQSGYAFVFWSANQGGEPFVHMCDVTIRYNVSIGTNCGLSLGDEANVEMYGPSIHPRRTHAHDNLFIAQGEPDSFAPDGSSVGYFCLPEPGHADICIENNTCIGPGSNIALLVEALQYDHFEFTNNVLGNVGSAALDSSSGMGDTTFALMNAGGTCTMSGNVFVGTAGSAPSGNTVLAAVSDVGFANATKATDITFAYADLDAMVISGTYAGKGVDITALKAALPSTVVFASADLPT